MMDALDLKLNQIFGGKVVRKDLLHRVKKGTNVPTFVLEFLLARYCASDGDEEIQAGIEAVLATLQDNYVRPDESNAAQSRVATKGKHKFIDKIHVRYVEKEKRHWASLENFNSQRIAISDRFYRDNERILEGGIWAEITIAANEMDQDDYAFYVEELRPIQLSRFDFEAYQQGRREFTRDEWLDAVMRSVGLEPSKMTKRLKFHFVARLAPLVEPNYNFVELGPRGTGKSYFYSEFSPYSTLISGGQATKATLFYNNARRRIGLVGFWDTIAFDEVAGIKIRDPDTIQIMKDFLANGRFSRGVEVIADASMAFVGNIDHSIDQIVNSAEYDLFLPLPPEFDLAVMDRFACYLPGWEMPKNSSEFLTNNYGFITDYLCEAFHYQFSHTNRYEDVNKRIRLGKDAEGRDEKGIKKTICAFLKILHPDGAVTPEEFDEYTHYAVELRRRVKEQMNKRKPDDEFAKINLSYVSASGKEVIVHCPESRNAMATLEPARRGIHGEKLVAARVPAAKPTTTVEVPASVPEAIEVRKPLLASNVSPPEVLPTSAAAKSPIEQHFTIYYGDTGYTFDSIFSPYLTGANEVIVEDPYIRITHQVHNFVRLCETIVKNVSVRQITLVTTQDENPEVAEKTKSMLEDVSQSLLEMDVVLKVRFHPNLHDREIRIDNGWTVKIGRGLDIYQKPTSYFDIGSNDLSLRKCLETKVDIYKAGSNPTK